jgi:aspartyl aminopeptidase
MFEEFSAFVQACPTPFHFAAYSRSLLLSQGFTEVIESQPSPSPSPANGFVVRDERSLFAWRDRGHSAAVFAGRTRTARALF